MLRAMAHQNEVVGAVPAIRSSDASHPKRCKNLSPYLVSESRPSKQQRSHGMSAYHDEGKQKTIGVLINLQRLLP